MGNYKTNQIMTWDGQKVTDHNRTPLEETFEVIENKRRMASGTMRRYIIAKKRTWSTSWENLPSNNNTAGLGTVDGGMSGEQMLAFWLTKNNSFPMVIKDGSGASRTYTVLITSFDFNIEKRGNAVDLWSVNVTLEEV